jgi:hypothetical protein
MTKKFFANTDETGVWIASAPLPQTSISRLKIPGCILLSINTRNEVL